MKVTKIEIVPIHPRNGLIAFASIELDNMFYVSSIGIHKKLNYIACCPAHEDSNPSLSVSQGDDGKVLVNCFSGCAIEDICFSIGIKISELFAEKSFGVNAEARKRIVYPYHDQEGKMLFSKICIEPGFDGKPKSFYWERLMSMASLLRILKAVEKCFTDYQSLCNPLKMVRLFF